MSRGNVGGATSVLQNKRMQLTSGRLTSIGASCWRRAPMRRYAPPLRARVFIKSPLAADPRC